MENYENYRELFCRQFCTSPNVNTLPVNGDILQFCFHKKKKKKILPSIYKIIVRRRKSFQISLLTWKKQKRKLRKIEGGKREGTSKSKSKNNGDLIS
jgi:hypothetical protein